MYITYTNSSTFLKAELLRLAQLERDIRVSGIVAKAGWAVDTSRGLVRARPPRVKGKAVGKTISLGRISSAEHRDWQRR